ncbi:hypothetical protein Dimus_035904, partial [Dionaea muscipula]
FSVGDNGKANIHLRVRHARTLVAGDTDAGRIPANTVPAAGRRWFPAAAWSLPWRPLPLGSGAGLTGRPAHSGVFE